MVSRLLPCSAALLIAAAAPLPCETIVLPTGIGGNAPSPVTSLHPYLSAAVANIEARLLLLRPLVWPDAQGRMDAERSLAGRIEVVAGGAVYRVTLKLWRWSDGRPVTAEDARFAWERIEALRIDADHTAFAFDGQGGLPDRVRDVAVEDARRFTIVLDRAVNPEWFIRNALSVFTPLPARAWGPLDRDTQWRRQSDPALFAVSDGPFVLERLALDRYASFVPNPYYGGRHPAYRRLVLAFGGDAPLHALQAGDLDAAHLPFPLVGVRAPGPRFRAVELPPTAGWRGIALNLRNERVAFLRDGRVRRALTLAIDQATIVRTVFHGASQAVTGPLLPDRAARSPYDPAAAAALLEAAGWRRGADGVRVRAGQRLSLTVLLPAESAEVEASLALVAANLAAVGVEVRLRRMEAEALFATVEGEPAAWEAAVVATTLSPYPSDEQDLHADGFGPGRLRDPALDAAVTASIERPGEAGLAAFARIVAADVPWLFLPEGNFTLWVDRRVRGVADFASALGYRSPEYLEVDAAGCRADEP